MRPRFSRLGALPALQQGHLDGLCGVYAILNAITWLVGDRLHLKRDALNSLFGLLLRVLDDDVGVRVAMLSGTKVRTLMALLRFACAAMQSHHGMAIAVQRPLLRIKRPSLALAVELMTRATFDARAAYLIGLDGYHDHWSVCTAVSPRSLILRDSCGLRRIALANCRMRHEPLLQKRVQHVLASTECVLIAMVN